MIETRHHAGFFAYQQIYEPMKKFVLQFPSRQISCDVIIERSLLRKLARILKKNNYSRDYILLTDGTVKEL